MKKIILLLIALQSSVLAEINTNNYNWSDKNDNSWTWYYPLSINGFKYQIEAKGSQEFYKFKSNLKKDKNVVKELKNNNNTGLISYLLFEDNKIVIDESDIPDQIVDGLLPSHSMGKSLVSYVTGHAICEGYISNVDERLTGWNVIENTLYEDQILIDLLNMAAGDQEYIGNRSESNNDGQLVKGGTNANPIPLKRIMAIDLQNSKKSKPIYNYSALTTHVIFNYVIHKAGNDWEKLLHKVFNEHIKVKNNIYFEKTPRGVGYKASARYSFFATRYDYLRIAKTMMDDWNSDTCIGQYLKTVYDRRILKNDNRKEPNDVNNYTKKYGGQFHFDIFGMEDRKIIGMAGFGGQNILIDVDNKKIIVINALFGNYDWKKIAYDKL